MVAIVLFGLVLKRLVPKLPLMLFLAVLSTVVTIQGAWPLAETTTAVLKQVDFMSLPTTVLALAGFSVARQLPMFRRLGWRSVMPLLPRYTVLCLVPATVFDTFHSQTTQPGF